MRPHIICKECGNIAWDCLRVVNFFRVSVYATLSNTYYCPLCFAEAERIGSTREFTARVQSLGADICKTCLYDPYVPITLGEYLPTLPTGYRYLPKQAEAPLFYWDRGLGEWREGRLPPPATKQAKGIQLLPGQLRCSCNNCARLQVFGATT